MPWSSSLFKVIDQSFALKPDFLCPVRVRSDSSEAAACVWLRRETSPVQAGAPEFINP